VAKAVCKFVSDELELRFYSKFDEVVYPCLAAFLSPLHNRKLAKNLKKVGYGAAESMLSSLDEQPSAVLSSSSTDYVSVDQEEAVSLMSILRGRKDQAVLASSPKKQKISSQSNEVPAQTLELTQYSTLLDGISSPDEKDPLLWWKRQSAVFPLLSNLARKILAIPATSCSTERLFKKSSQNYEGRGSLTTSLGESQILISANAQLLETQAWI
jgi:hypothetical protein